MTLRVVIITFGSYALTDGLAAMLGLSLHMLGVPLSDAMLLSVLIAFLLFIAIIMWGFANRNSWKRPLLITIAAIVTKCFVSNIAHSVLS
jgi:hypothetical protein